MNLLLPKIVVIGFAAALLALAINPSWAQGYQGGSQGRHVPRHGVVPYDSNMSMIDRMARRNMERRHIERRMRLSPPHTDRRMPRRSGGGAPHRR